NEIRELRYVAFVQRQRLDLTTVHDHAAIGSIGLNQWGLSFNRDSLDHVADFEVDIHSRGLTDIKLDPTQCLTLETVFRRRDFINTRLQSGDSIVSVRIGRGCRSDARTHFGSNDSDARNDR